MAVQAELEIIGTGSGATRCVVGHVAVVVGRSGTCDYVVDKTVVSREHVALWTEGDRVLVRDLRSRNGTFVNDARIETAELSDGDVLRLGASVMFRVVIGNREDAPIQRILALCDVVSGHRYPLGPYPLRLGTAPDSAVRLPTGAADQGAVVSPRPGEAWFYEGDDMKELAVGETFQLSGMKFRIDEMASDPGNTMAEAAVPWPYKVFATLDAEGGPRAVVEDTHAGRKHELVGTNRAVLLYLLARRWSRDARLDIDADEVGWCSDEDLARGIWGRDGAGRPIKVLLCRLRGELRESGFDPWFFEKRRGALRIRVMDAETG